MIRRPPRSTLSSSSAASDVYKRQVSTQSTGAATQSVMERGEMGGPSPGRKNHVDMVERAIEYALLLIGTPYAWWTGGAIPIAAPMWAEDAPAPDPTSVASVNCAGLTNLMLRSVEQPLPWAEHTGRGGTAAYGEVYARSGVAFALGERYPRGTLLLRRYRNVQDQGHVAVVLDDAGASANVLQSFSYGHPSESPGVSASYTVEESHAGGFYELAVLPEHWLTT
eukprot:TRINITY_DN29391_c0_g1_i1.p1 TRINITY_DN29391_c0_g1~~TRINITY_DN29391_c0_g1_i1.p1  ORF type:complete len:224 (-),score=41.44 TRINITY_DN29391_c0_g1_i1:127-798(-)